VESTDFLSSTLLYLGGRNLVDFTQVMFHFCHVISVIDPKIHICAYSLLF